MPSLLFLLALAAALQTPPPERALQADLYGVARPDGVFSFEEAMKHTDIGNLVRARNRGTPSVDQTVSGLREIQFDTLTQQGQRIADICASRCHIAGEIKWEEPNAWRFTRVTQIERLPYNFDFASLGAAPVAGPVDPALDMRNLRDGDPLRQTLLETLRIDIEGVLGQPLKLEPTLVRTQGDWAYIVSQPRTRDGGAVDFNRTRYADQQRRGPWDGGVTHALYRKVQDRWILTAYLVSPVARSLVERWPGDYGAPMRILAP